MEEHNGSNTNSEIWLLLEDWGWIKSEGTDKWIPNHPTNGVIHPPEEEVQEWYVSDLIN